MTELDLGTLRGHVDLDLAAFDRKYGQVDSLLDQLARRQVPDVRVDADTQRAEQNLEAVDTALRTVDGSTAEASVLADASRAEAEIGTAERALQAVDGETAEMTVDADTAPAEDALDGLGDEGTRAGEDAGAGLSDGIKGALVALPVAGAVVLAGLAIGKTLLEGITDALSVEVGRDLFSARTGLDEATAGRFGRAAGEAYANVFGESVDANLDTARHALQQGLIDENATQAEIQTVIQQLTGISDVFEYDIPAAARGVGQMLKTGMVRDAEEAFDLIARASQGVMSDDLMDTLNEYASQFETVGLTGYDAMGLIRQGLDEGARDTDKVADAVKEMGLRIREGTEPAREALENLGVDVDGVVTGFQEGGPQARDAMQVVFEALRELDEQGGNTQEVIAALFGGPGEDLGAALFALDLETARTALGETEGAAQSLLDTLGDNAATQIEGAKRNIEVAADGIKAALAAAFSDEISGAADWVSRNRGPIMEFLLDAANGGFDLGVALAEAFLTGQRAIGEFLTGPIPQLLYGLADVAHGIDAITPGDQGGLTRTLEEGATAAHQAGITMQEAADRTGTSWTDALEDMRDGMNSWAAPEIMAAHTHDALLEMAGRVDEFTNHLNTHGNGTITINGDTMNAEEALSYIEGEVNEGGGYVTINGETMLAEDALDYLMNNKVGLAEESVTINGDTAEARRAVESRLAWIANQGENVDVAANTAPAYEDVALLQSSISQRVAYIQVRANMPDLNGAASGSGRMGTFSEGGYTGDLPVNAVAGIVHGQEMVIDAANTREWRPLLEAIHSDSITPADLARSSGLAPFAAPNSGGTASMEGAHITGTLVIGGDGLARIIDGRIEKAGDGTTRNFRQLTGRR